MKPVAIVVPVFNAIDDLRACIDSVRAHTPKGTYRLILIDDASSDERVAAFFGELAELDDPDLELLRNHQNLGFVATTNRGMALFADLDVLLLNSDTLVTSSWLDRMQRCAASDRRIGTITPFSNNAEICSFPLFCRDNPLSDLPPLDRIAAAFAARKPIYPDIPTAVGFCMYIRRSLLSAIGNFDAETFGKGYGEENDFCMRAAAAGFRNVLCDDAFVAHTGGRSFNEQKRALMQENGRRLLARYPHYAELVQQFIAVDPLREIRESVWERLMTRSEAYEVAVRPAPFWRRWLTR